MRFALCLCLTAVLLSGCSNTPFDLTAQTLAAVAPSVPGIPDDVQDKAAKEMASGVAPAENQVINACLQTRDEARVLNPGKKK
jgi:hypothetical protein